MNIQNMLAYVLVLGTLGLGGCTGLTNQTDSNSSPISVTPASLNFGNVALGNGTAQLVSLTNTGSENVTLASISASANGFGTSAGSNLTLMPNQSVTISVSFHPKAAGRASGDLSIVAPAMKSVLKVGLSGTGTTQPNQHSVTLDWSPSESAVVGYYVYRAVVSGGPYVRLNTSVDPDSSFIDSSVATGETYYYVVTSIDFSNVESGFSNEVVVSVP